MKQKSKTDLRKITETLDAKILTLLDDFGIEGADRNADLKDEIISLITTEILKGLPEERLKFQRDKEGRHYPVDYRFGFNEARHLIKDYIKSLSNKKRGEEYDD